MDVGLLQVMAKTWWVRLRWGVPDLYQGNPVSQAEACTFLSLVIASHCKHITAAAGGQADLSQEKMSCPKRARTLEDQQDITCNL